MTYDNRLNAGKCEPCSEPETTISNISCGTSKIFSITKVEDKVVVMFDDCSYMTAPLCVVDSNFCKEEKAKVQVLEGKVTAVIDRLSKIEEKLKDTIEVSNFKGNVSFVAFNPTK